jgi:hypothetical protein
LPEAPEPLLVERRVETGDDAYVERITADGGVWTGGNVEATLEDGEWHFGRGESTWKREATLSADALAALRDAVARSGFFETAREHRPDVAVIHGSRETWTADLDGRRHTSTLHGRGVTQVPQLSALAAALDRALASTDQG